MQSPNIEKFMLTILGILIIIIFGGCIYAFFFAIYQFIFAGNDSAKRKSAWDSIRYMILGVIMTIVFLFTFPVLFKKLNVPGYEQYNAQNIFKTAGSLLYGLFGFAGETIDTYNSGIYDPGIEMKTQPSQPSSLPKNFEL